MRASQTSGSVRPRGFRGWIFACGLLALLPACESTGNNGAPSASPMQHPLLENIPIPHGFETVDDQSVGRASGKLRVAQFTFTGDTDRAAVNRFFREYMPSAGFTLKERRFDRGIYDMRFESDAEACNIRIKREKMKTVVVIDVGPLPQGETEQAAPPPPPRRPANGDDAPPPRRPRPPKQGD